MLKIKDNVDLKELEKFGFEFNNSWHMNCWNFSNDDRWTDYSIDVVPKTREVECHICTGNEDCSLTITGLPNILFDLIQAGLVEKVVE